MIGFGITLPILAFPCRAPREGRWGLPGGSGGSRLVARPAMAAYLMAVEKLAGIVPPRAKVIRVVSRRG